ncbi:hypothetical protein RF11_01144 [Thelohanellus kitauei]|uniref:Uncharacterized protein n=1 Tax=Thelohanellus kitauei TaxID=669202 RepID=A0A0C2MJ04_THEKT|nr:hypothetical protein RF11_01144 [Thelohanellus kitauei]
MDSIWNTESEDYGFQECFGCSSRSLITLGYCFHPFCIDIDKYHHVLIAVDVQSRFLFSYKLIVGLCSNDDNDIIRPSAAMCSPETCLISSRTLEDPESLLYVFLL